MPMDSRFARPVTLPVRSTHARPSTNPTLTTLAPVRKFQPMDTDHNPKPSGPTTTRHGLSPDPDQLARGGGGGGPPSPCPCPMCRLPALVCLAHLVRPAARPKLQSACRQATRHRRRQRLPSRSTSPVPAFTPAQCESLFARLRQGETLCRLSLRRYASLGLVLHWAMEDRTTRQSLISMMDSRARWPRAGRL